MPDRHRTLFRVAGLVVWLSAGVMFPACDKGLMAWPPTVVGYLGFAAAFWWLTSPAPKTPGATVSALLFQAAGAALLLSLHPYYLTANLLVIVAWEAALLLETGAVVAWILGQSLIPVAALGLSGKPIVWPYILALLGFQGFGVVAAQLLKAELRASRRLNAALAELTMAQAVLTETSKIAERQRISRDLHDALGHSLTGLVLQLDVATRLEGPDAAPYVARARAISGDMLGQVRDVVSDIRKDADQDLAVTLTRMMRGVEGLALHLEVAEACRMVTGEQAVTVMRVVQEAVTNTVRHAGASHLHISVWLADGTICVSIEDDGRGAGQAKPGHGLRGMRERLAALGGTLEIGTSGGGGFGLSVRLPLESLG